MRAEQAGIIVNRGFVCTQELSNGFSPVESASDLLCWATASRRSSGRRFAGLEPTPPWAAASRPSGSTSCWRSWSRTCWPRRTWRPCSCPPRRPGLEVCDEYHAERDTIWLATLKEQACIIDNRPSVEQSQSWTTGLQLIIPTLHILQPTGLELYRMDWITFLVILVLSSHLLRQ